MNKLKSKKINAILVISAFIFNILIFAPLEIYYTNKNEFWFKIKDFLPITIVVSIVASSASNLWIIGWPSMSSLKETVWS